MSLVEDFSIFFDNNDFAVTASFTPRTGGAAIEINGIFDKEYIAIGEAEVGVAATQPMFQTNSNNISNARGGQLVIGNLDYNIIEVKQDGTGTTILVLEED